MDYPTHKGKLIMPEYGRNIQQMVEHALTIEDREERTRCVHSIIHLHKSQHKITRMCN